MADNTKSDVIPSDEDSSKKTEFTYDNSEELFYLKSIDENIKRLVRDGRPMSQANARMAGNPYEDSQTTFRRMRGGKSSNGLGGFTDEFEKALWESVLGSDFKEKIGKAVSTFAESIGVEIKDIPGAVGKYLGQEAVSLFKETKLGENFYNKVDEFKKSTLSNLRDSFEQGYKDATGQDSPWAAAKKASKAAAEKQASEAAKVATNLSDSAEVIGDAAKATEAAEGVATASGSAAQLGTTLEGLANGAVSMLGEGLTLLGPEVLAVVAGLIALEAASELIKKAFKYALGPAIEGTAELFEELKKSANRRESTRKAYREEAEKRYKLDIDSIVRAPFKILEEAAERVEQAWDANLRKINATQGYSKADLQALMATYADRLREDNLSAVVSGSDIINNLSSILDQGLSGEVANEFAYLATILNAAIPTQDFFGYASTYSTIAANAIKDGKSQSEALKYANSQLESFASSVLYASRELAGGFSTGLKNAQSLFEDAVKISQSSRTGVPSEIAGVLTSVSAIVGAIAPDLSTSLADAVTKAAIGGNSSDVVALRSLAGINASNTEFLKALAKDPQRVFSNLFTNLATIFNDTDDAWMEKAEAYSQVFGLSMDAFARIDFNYLADAVSRMKVDNSSLLENLDQLISGETTTNKELLRMQQVNKYMVEEGLAYVLDNEVAQAIQQHMWDEQIAREIQENEYAVNLKGKALEFLDSLRTTLERILNIFNPVKWRKKAVVDVAGAIAESFAQDADIRRILEAGKVGSGNSRDLYNLTHRNQDLQLTPNYAELLTGRSAFNVVSGLRGTLENILHATDSIANPLGFINNLATASDVVKWRAREASQLSAAVVDVGKSIVRSIQSDTSTFNSARSVYNWELVSKSAAADLHKLSNYLSSSNYTSTSASTLSNVSEQSQDLYSARFQNLLSAAQNSFDTMYDAQGKYVLDNDITKYGSYDEWEKYILKQANIRSMKDFLSYGMEESEVEQIQKDLRNAFENAQTAAGGQEEYAEREDQRALRGEQRNFWQETRDEWARVEEYRLYEQEFRTRQEQFWADAQTAWQADYDQDTAYFDAILQNLGEEGPIYLKLKSFMDEWVKYFVLHQAYRDAYDSSAVERIQREERGEASTAVYKLAEALTNNDTELLDPVMQTNALLSQILLVAQAIMQQNNSTSGGNTSLFNSLQATALGLVNNS